MSGAPETSPRILAGVGTVFEAGREFTKGEMKEGAVGDWWSIGCRGSREKFEFSCWESRGALVKNKMDETASNPSLDRIIFPRCRFDCLGSKCHIKRLSRETACGLGAFFV